ncbi:MAG: hypothetical protein FWF92_07485 [Oscillospiraceae bacterium]|nr:hypothetical protein [Oscillospiraceae bacterium]
MKTKTETETENFQERKSRRTAAIDFFKTVAIYLLTASMLTAAGVYISNRQNASQPAEMPWEKRRIIESGGVPAEININESQINPIQITITANGDSFTAIYNYKLISDSDINENFIKYSIRGIFSKNSECRRLEKEEGENLWKSCTEKENSVYVKYAGNYIYPVIYTFLDETWDIRNAADAFSDKNRELAMVHELFIVDEAPVYGIAKDTDGNVSVFIPETETGNIIKSYINTENLLTYNNTAGVIPYPCEFLKGDDISSKTGINSNNIRNLKFPVDFHLFYNHNTYSSVLKFSNPVSDENGKINTDQDFIRNLFKIFNFNIENSSSYPINNGITFTDGKDGKNTVSFYNDGRIIYNYKPSDLSLANLSDINEPGGIHLIKFLGYDAGYYTSYEKIKAASVFVSSLDSELTGNGCSIYLKNIISDSDENLKVIFCYYYDGIKIKINGSDEGIVITINKNSITEVKINSLYLSSLNVMIKNMNPILILTGTDDLITRDIESVEYTDNGNGEEVKKTKEEIAQKYKLKYDKIQDKFIVNEFELIYNIKYTDGKNNGDSVKAVWEIR